MSIYSRLFHAVLDLLEHVSSRVGVVAERAKERQHVAKAIDVNDEWWVTQGRIALLDSCLVVGDL